MEILKKWQVIFLITFVFISITAFTDSKQIISDYYQTFIPGYDNAGHLKIAIRSYSLNGEPYFLVVNPYTFSTEALPVTNFKPRKTEINAPGYFTMKELLNTPYIKALLSYTAPPYKLENDGLTKADYPVKGFFLTVDMCPSIKPFEAEFFKKLVAKAEQTHHAIPVALSMSGLWMIHHPTEFQWLIKQKNDNKLQITWINHSFSHVYYADLPFKENFLLTPQTNMDHEILATEKVLLQNHQLPSVFFRFPGLASNKELILKLRHFGLIPVGSDAWLAKDQQAKEGSIILVHGNSNEPEGIKRFIPLLQKPDFNLLPLNKALSQ